MFFSYMTLLLPFVLSAPIISWRQRWHKCKPPGLAPFTTTGDGGWWPDGWQRLCFAPLPSDAADVYVRLIRLRTFFLPPHWAFLRL